MNRPTSVTVFGVLNLVFAVMGTFGLAMAAIVIFFNPFPQPEGLPTSEVYDTFNKLMFPVSVVGALMLGASGIGLLLMRPWGRVLAVAYSMLTVVTTIAAMVMQWIFFTGPILEYYEGQEGPEASGALIGAIGGSIGGVVGLIFPVLLWYFMTRPRVVAAFHGVPAPANGEWSPALAASRTGDLSNPYSSPETDTMPAWSDRPGGGETIVETFIPSKNGPALASYYLGIFSLFPCLGFPLGIAAVYFGIQGLRRVRATPEVRGGAHAWAGVICGSLFGLFNLLLIGLLVLGAVAAAMGY